MYFFFFLLQIRARYLSYNVSKRVATPKTTTITRGPSGFLILLTSRHPVNEAIKLKKQRLLHGISAERNMTFLVLVSAKITQTPAELPKKKSYFNSRDKSNEEI